MAYPVYYVVEGDTLPHLFDTFDGGTGASITMTGLAVTDIEIYKDGGPTQRASDAGYTLLDTDGIDFDGITGIHGFSIDLSDNTDAGFYSVGPWYHVVVSTITVDAQTVSFVACAFRIVSATRGMAGTALPAAAADAAGGLPISDAGGLDLDSIKTDTAAILVDTADMQPKLGTPAGASISADIAAIEAQTDDIGAAGAGLTAVPWNAAWDAEVQSEVADALDAAVPATPTAGSINERIKTMDDADIPTALATVDSNVDAILVDTGTTLPGTLGTPAGADLATDIAAIKTDTAAILVDTADMQPKLGTPAGASMSADIAAVKVDTAATLADTGTDGVVVAAASKTGYALSAAGVDAVWDEAQAGHTTAGTFGKYLDTEVSGVSGGGGTTQKEVHGSFFRDGSTYFFTAHLKVDGVVVATGISSPTVVGVYGNNGSTDLTYSASTAIAVDGTTGIIYGAGTLGTAPTNGNPAVLIITVVHGGATIRGHIEGAAGS